MQKFKFGGMQKKKIEVSDDGTISVKGLMSVNGEFNINRIKTIYIKEPTLMETGTCFLSFDGRAVYNPVILSNGFFYTRKQEEDLNKFIGLIQEANEEVNVANDTVVNLKTMNPEKKATKSDKSDKHTVKCPKCKSINVDFMDNKRKNFSVGKAVAGGALTGGIGTLAGFAGKKGKDRWHCRDCGNTFTK